VAHVDQSFHIEISADRGAGYWQDGAVAGMHMIQSLGLANEPDDSLRIAALDFIKGEVLAGKCGCEVFARKNIGA
jgi:hypothetical protein